MTPNTEPAKTEPPVVPEAIAPATEPVGYQPSPSQHAFLAELSGLRPDEIVLREGRVPDNSKNPSTGEINPGLKP